MKNKYCDKQFYKTVLVIGIPIVIQNLIGLGLNMADTIMIGKLGVDELAAVGTANRLYFIFSTLCFGIYSGAAVYVSQYWGVKDIKNIRGTFGIEFLLGSIVSLTFTIMAIFFAPQILGLFTSDPNVIRLGCQYLYIVAISYIFTSLSFAINFNCRAIHMLKAPTIINLVALLLNLLLNYILIFGKFGAPRMGGPGAALATLIARVVEFVLPRRGNMPEGRRLVLLVIVATLPLFAILPIEGKVEAFGNNPVFVSCALLVTGCILFFSDRMGRGSKTVRNTTLTDALLIGVAQGCATIPGLSRSGCTISAGMALGLDRKFAVRFSFLMSLPAVLGATILKVVKTVMEAEPIPAGMMPKYLLGMVIAGVVGYFSIKLVNLLAAKGKFGAFAYYCWAAGLVSLAANYFFL